MDELGGSQNSEESKDDYDDDDKEKILDLVDIAVDPINDPFSEDESTRLDDEYDDEETADDDEDDMDEVGVLNGNENDISIDDILDANGGEAYYSIADSYYQLSDEIDNVLLEVDPDLSEAGLAYARMVFINDLEVYDDSKFDEEDDELDEDDEVSSSIKNDDSKDEDEMEMEMDRFDDGVEYFDLEDEFGEDSSSWDE